jgi:glycosyltransferase involved in cell wall biosynthesis
VISDRNIVCIASSWFDHPTSKHHVMRTLARRNHVLWVNYHASRRPQLSARDGRLLWQRLCRVAGGVQRVLPTLDVLSPLLIPMPEVPWARWLNGVAIARQIRAALRRLPSRPVQLWLFTPDIPELPARLITERVVYYCVDDFAAFSGFNTALVERLEHRTLAASDVVITTSAKLFTERQPLHPRVHLVPHGVDFAHFACVPHLPESAIPADLRRIRRPVLGYMGIVSDYVDLDLLVQAARRRPDWSIVLLGDTRCDLGALAAVPNVHWLKGRPYEQLPAYCRGFDVGLIPFRQNRLVQAVNPIKLREYLAAGLPVVSASMDTVRGYGPAVQLADTLPEFLAACESALRIAADGHPEARQDLVRADGWDARVDYLSELVSGNGQSQAAPQGQARDDYRMVSPNSVMTSVSPRINTAQAASAWGVPPA